MVTGGTIINFVEIGAFLSVLGFYCMYKVFRIKKSQSWETSSKLKQILWLITALVLQLPIILVIVYKPPYVSNITKVEPFSFSQLGNTYIVCIVLLIIIWALIKVLPFHSNKNLL